MYGGILLSQNIVVLQKQGLLLAAYSNSVFCFDLQQTHIHHVLPLQYDIVAVQSYSDDSICTLDLQGNLTLCQISQLKCSVKSSTFNIGALAPIQKALFIQLAANVTDTTQKGTNKIQYHAVLWYICQGTLYEWRNHNSKQIAQNVNAFYKLQAGLIAVVSNNIVYFYSATANDQTPWNYNHHKIITSVSKHENDLIIADNMGKIYLLGNFFSQGIVSFTNKLQWHLHSVHALKVHTPYLYSVGEEGVVVMWHLREHTRDFLPRIGAQISNLFIHRSTVVCTLSDNSIKTIDLATDKSLKIYKTITNPRGMKTAHNYQPDPLVKVDFKGTKICMKSLPGSLQILHTNSGFNQQVQIIPRNRICRLDTSYPDPIDIVSYAFDENWSILGCVLINSNNHSINFFSLQNGQYRLCSKVFHPHSSVSSNILYLSDGVFATYSSKDSNIKFWSLKRDKKKSLLDTIEQYWNCIHEINQKNLMPLWISYHRQRLYITYQRQYTIMNTQSFLIEATKYIDSANQCTLKKVIPLKQGILLYTNKKLFLQINAATYIILEYEQEEEINIVSNKHNIAIWKNNNIILQIYVYDISKMVYTYSINCSYGNIIPLSLFWIEDTLALLNDHMMIQNVINNKQIFTIGKNKPQQVYHIMEIEDSNDYQHQLDQKYSSIAQRYKRRKNKQIMVRIHQLDENITHYPNFKMALKTFSQAVCF